MIQRMQTVWLLLASLCGFLTLKFSFYSGMNEAGVYENLTAYHNTILLVLTIGTALLALINIFFYKNRKQQIRICLIGMLAQAGCLAIYFLTIQKFTQGTFDLWSVFALGVLVFFILAVRNIYKDEKLVKSLDRLR
jgi:peptidoglycan/LPS O-acetylase OafA/YrhL